jgi:hypothetical protein
MTKMTKIKTIKELITEDNSALRRARLLALTQIASEHQETRGDATTDLKNLLELTPENREASLMDFFGKYIPGGWITIEGVTVEDQEFLRNVTISGNPFWFDWG